MEESAFQNKLLSMARSSKLLAFMLTQNRDDSHDLYQDTYLKATENREKFREDTNFQGWVNTIMRNIFINKYHVDIRKRKMIANSIDLDNVAGSTYSGYISPEGYSQIVELKSILHKLPAKEKKIFNLRIQGYKYKEISTKLHLPIGTIKSSIHLWRQKILKHINR